MSHLAMQKHPQDIDTEQLIEAFSIMVGGDEPFETFLNLWMQGSMNGRPEARVMNSLISPNERTSVLGRLEESVRTGPSIEGIKTLMEQFSYRPFWPEVKGELRIWFSERFSAVKGSRHNISTFLSPYNQAIVKELANHPEEMYKLQPRQFEILMAEILNDLGWTVELTPQSKDGGRDIVATIPFGSGRLMGLVECKRYAAHNKVEMDVVERFIYTVREREKASFGMLATTSFFTRGAIEAAQRHQWQIQLNDFDHLRRLLGSFGQYHQNSNSGLWLFQGPQTIARPVDGGA